jgi:hypothetical protein
VVGLAAEEGAELVLDGGSGAAAKYVGERMLNRQGTKDAKGRRGCWVPRSCGLSSSEEEKQRQENGGEVVQVGEKLPEGGKCIKRRD